MRLDPKIVQAIAIVHSGLIHSAPLPQDPQHAYNAKSLVEDLQSKLHGDSTLTVCAAQIVYGYLNNKNTAHCLPPELVNLAVTAMHYILDACRSPTVQMKAPTGPAQMPQTAVPEPVPQEVPKFPEPTTPLEVPDFG